MDLQFLSFRPFFRMMPPYNTIQNIGISYTSIILEPRGRAGEGLFESPSHTNLFFFEAEAISLKNIR